MQLAVLFALLATLGSVFNLTKISVKTHATDAPKSLSERATLAEDLLLRFRKTLFIYTTLFAIAIYCFVAPGNKNTWWIVAAWTVTYSSIIAVAILPASGKTFRPHLWAAQVMGIGMLWLAYTFWKSYSGVGSTVELVLAIAMTVLAVLTYADSRRYIFHELGFIYLNHLTILVAALFMQ